jgi:hypothetical protein
MEWPRPLFLVVGVCKLVLLSYALRHSELRHERACPTPPPLPPDASPQAWASHDAHPMTQPITFHCVVGILTAITWMCFAVVPMGVLDDADAKQAKDHLFMCVWVLGLIMELFVFLLANVSGCAGEDQLPYIWRHEAYLAVGLLLGVLLTVACVLLALACAVLTLTLIGARAYITTNQIIGAGERVWLFVRHKLPGGGPTQGQLAPIKQDTLDKNNQPHRQGNMFTPQELDPTTQDTPNWTCTEV